jgi:hypothetical protein
VRAPGFRDAPPPCGATAAAGSASPQEGQTDTPSGVGLPHWGQCMAAMVAGNRDAVSDPVRRPRSRPRSRSRSRFGRRGI